MGTRNLTMVQYKDRIALAKYGQCDGDLSSLGNDIVKFLNSEFKKEEFIQNLQNVKNISTDEDLKALGDKDDDFKEGGKFYSLNRDCSGSDAFQLIQSGKMTYACNSEEFAYDSLFCEYGYLLNLDNDTLEIYRGFNEVKLPKTARFYRKEPDEDGYYGIRLYHTYPLSKLPQDLSELDKQLEAESEA